MSRRQRTEMDDAYQSGLREQAESIYGGCLHVTEGSSANGGGGPPMTAKERAKATLASIKSKQVDRAFKSNLLKPTTSIIVSSPASALTTLSSSSSTSAAAGGGAAASSAAGGIANNNNNNAGGGGGGLMMMRSHSFPLLEQQQSNNINRMNSQDADLLSIVDDPSQLNSETEQFSNTGMGGGNEMSNASSLGFAGSRMARQLSTAIHNKNNSEASAGGSNSIVGASSSSSLLILTRSNKIATFSGGGGNDENANLGFSTAATSSSAAAAAAAEAKKREDEDAKRIMQAQGRKRLNQSVAEKQKQEAAMKLKSGTGGPVIKSDFFVAVSGGGASGNTNPGMARTKSCSSSTIVESATAHVGESARLAKANSYGSAQATTAGVFQTKK